LTLTNWTARAVVLAPLLWAGWECARVARADFVFRELNSTAVARAVELDPGNARYLSTLAQIRERQGSDPRPLLRRALALSPLDADRSVRLALAEEAAGDSPAAERALLDAARLSRKYYPRWALANFYFRHGRRDEFWNWARESLAVSYGDRTPLFDLCAAAAGASQDVVDRALPHRRDARLAYARYASVNRRLDDVARLVEELATSAGPEDRPMIRGLCRPLVAGFRIREAHRAWVRAAIDDPPFGWHATQARGLGVYPRTGGGWSISLDGTQAERVELLSRVAPVAGSCSLTVRSQGSVDGLRWIVTQHSPGAESLGESPTGSMSFRVAQGVEAVRIALHYERPVGAVRAEGSIVVEAAEVSCAR
jgi:hypothetical protein